MNFLTKRNYLTKTEFVMFTLLIKDYNLQFNFFLKNRHLNLRNETIKYSFFFHFTILFRREFFFI